MRLPTSKILLFFFIAMAISGCSKNPVYEATDSSEVPEMEQKIISFNLSNYSDNGSRKWELRGDSANIMSEIIYLTNISVESYDKPKINLTSDNGNYNKDSRVVTLDNNVLLETSDGIKLVTDSIQWDGATDVISTAKPVTITRSDVVANGVGAKALPEMKKLVLTKDVEVIIMSDVMGGMPIEELESVVEGNGESKAIITCDGPLEIDYENNIAVFNDNVKVDDKRGQIYSEVMSAHLDPVSKSIVRVVAEGEVKVIRGKDSTYSQKAIYTTVDQKIILVGSPKIFIHADDEIAKVEKGFEKASW